MRDSLAKVMAKEALTPGRSMRYTVVGPAGPGAKAKAAGARLGIRGRKAKVRGAKSGGANAAGGDAIHVIFSRESDTTARPRPLPKGRKTVRASLRAARARSGPQITNIRGVVARTRDGRASAATPFVDRELEKLVGKSIRAEGTLIDPSTVLMSAWEEID